MVRIGLAPKAEHPEIRRNCSIERRGGIFAGTVNHSTYLRGETGGRRFWPIACGRIDVDALARDRDQLWAEAKIRFESGRVWWLEATDLVQMASDEQIERYEGDPWKEVIGPWVEARPSVSISEVLEKCIQKAQAVSMQTDKNSMAAFSGD
jgi:predicted P-loop ATPase